MNDTSTTNDLVFLSERLSIGDQTKVIYEVLKHSNNKEFWIDYLGGTNDSKQSKENSDRINSIKGLSLDELLQRGHIISP